MVINLNIEIEKAKKEFDDNNYEKALEILDGAEVEEDYQKLAMIIRIASLMGLSSYDEAITVINSGIEKFPYDDFLWARKVECHYFNGDKNKAAKALEELDRIVNKDDKHRLVFLAEMYELVNNHTKALKYCNMALDIDGDFLDAISLKARVACSIKDNDMMSDCADRLLELYEDGYLKVMLPLMLKLFSARYRDCLNIINDVDVLDDEHDEMLKAILYKQMVEDLNIEIRTSSPIEMGVDDVLDVVLKYHYEGIENGEVNGALYLIKKCQ